MKTCFSKSGIGGGGRFGWFRGRVVPDAVEGCRRRSDIEWRATSNRRVRDNAPYLLRRVLSGMLLLIALTVGVRAGERVDILVQGAEKLEIGMIREALTDVRKVEVGPFSFWVGKVGPHKVAVSLTGQGLINCTASTVLGIEEFSPKLIVNQGTSGAQAPYLGLHDIIVGQRALDYGNFITPVRKVGEGGDALSWMPLAQKIRKGAGGELIAFPKGFAGDAACVEVAMRTRNPMGNLYAGVIGSAHEINLELDRVKWSRDTFGMDVEEMESGHVAALAHAYGVRYVAFRVVSDAPYDGVPFYALAGRAGALFTVNFLKNLPALE
jgi:adenosylhomocysteine nucleosidase